MVDYQPIGGTSYIELPKDVYDAKAVINVEIQDQECFKWSILAALHPASKDAQRVTKYQEYKEELNFEGINFPVTVDQISKFEKKQSRDQCHCHRDWRKENKTRCQTELFISFESARQATREKRVTSLYWERKEKYYYAWVKNLNRLFSRTKFVKNQTYFCERCFQGCVRPGLLAKHMETSQHISIQAVMVVDEEISFKNWAKTEETLFRIHADFECILKECKQEEGKTVKVQKHVPCSVAWVLISDHPEVESAVCWNRPAPCSDLSLEDISETVVDHLMETLQAVEKELLPFQLENKPMVITEEQKAAFQVATHYYMCEEPFYEDEEKWRKVRDHNHATGEYRGAAHNQCNLNKKRSTHIPVFFHNLRGYDSHLTMQGIHRFTEKKTIRVIPNNMERYVSFQLGNLRFLDSLQFLGVGASLDTLASNLTEFPHLKEHFSKV